MLKTIELIEGIDEKFVPMLKQVNIPDFTKCIARLSDMSMDEVSNAAIKDYLLLWAKNKYRFFKMFNDKLKIDTKFQYKRLKEETKVRLADLKTDYPVYMPWIEGFIDHTTNKIRANDMHWEQLQWMKQGFPHFQYEGSSITRFFKSCLNAPDDLVTRLGRVYENSTVNSIFTMSIDPVDIMLASETPYNWTSCYKLNPDEDETHADGCLAAMVDTTSLICYVWDKEGEYKFTETSHLKFKSIRYKKMRVWLSISPDMHAFYLNRIYPCKEEYENGFEKTLRLMIEKTIANYINEDNMWMVEYESMCYRQYPYGYDEYSECDRTYKLSKYEKEVGVWKVFDQRFKCPCGCGMEMPGLYDSEADEYDNYKYNGMGYCYENMNQQYYCELSDEYCSCEYGCVDCEDCVYWQDEHPVCSRDETINCENAQDYNLIVRCGVAHACEDCKGCKHWQDDEEEDEE